MNVSKSGILGKAKIALAQRRHLTLVGGLFALPLLFAGTQANARPVHFRYVGGHWSHTWHSGWHRYWGGPSIGFYYAPTPVYVVPGYSAPSYYVGPNFWYSNPSFGLSLNFGGGGYYRGGYYHGRDWHGSDRFHGDGGRFHSGGDRFHGGDRSRGGRDRR